MAKEKKNDLIWKRKVLHISHKKTRQAQVKKRKDLRKEKESEAEASSETTAPESTAVTSIYTRTEETAVPAYKVASEWSVTETRANARKIQVALKNRKATSTGAKGSPLASGNQGVTPQAKKAAETTNEIARQKLDYILNKRRKKAVKTKLADRASAGTKQAAMAAAKKSGSVISAGLKAAFAATKALVAALVALGSSFIAITIIIAMIAVFVGTGFGLFITDGGQNDNDMTVQEAILSLNKEYITYLDQLKTQNQPFDKIAIYGSKPRWKDVLTIFAAQTVTDDDMDVTSIDDIRYQKLSDVFWSMTTLTTELSQTTQTVTEEVDVTDEAGNPTGEKELVYNQVTTTLLKVNIQAKTAADMMSSLSPKAQEHAQELLDETNDSLWTELLGGTSGSSGAVDGDPAVVATYLLGQGFTKEATAAILGNIKAECGWNYSKIGILDGLYHSYERNIGIFQFTTLTPNPNSNDEYWRFMRWCEKNGLFYGSLHAQLDWAFSGEADTSHWTTRWVDRGRYYSNAPGFTEELYEKRNQTTESFMAETDVAVATYSWMAYYEGCTNGIGSHLDRRIAYAYEYYEQLMTVSPAGLIWPTTSNNITSYFGPRESPGGIGSTYHKGIDIAAPVGTEISAAAGGTVVIANYSATAGNWVKIDHGNGLQTVYMHCDELYVQKGQQVNQSDIIAATGNTGNSTGPHLHFGVMVNGDYKNPLDFVSPPA